MAISTAPLTAFNVALVQFHPKPLDAEGNFAYACGQIRLAKAQGASLAVLPEYHLTGWEPGHPSFALTDDEAQAYQQRYANLAAELHINICPGTTVSEAPLSSQSGKPALLNTSCFIDHDGKVLGTYTKTNLWIPERHHLTSSIDSQADVANCQSSPHQVFDTPLGPAGILVCWDLAFPEAFRALVRAGAKLIIIPSYWTLRDMAPEGLAYNAQCERTFVQSALVTRAFESTAAVVFCNAGGPVEEGFFGCSQVAMPVIGRVEGSFEDGEEAMRVVKVDMRLVEIAERNYQIRRDLGREDWHYGYVRDEGRASKPSVTAERTPGSHSRCLAQL